MLGTFRSPFSIKIQRDSAKLTTTVLKEHPNLLHILPEGTFKHVSAAHPWTVSNLRDILLRILSVEQVRLCLFIDGLDEFEDASVAANTDLVSFLSSLISNSNGRLKCCLASRPLDVFHDFCRPYPQLSMQQLTGADIARYVRKQLEGCCDEELVTEVVYKAEGIFLWVKLAVQNLLAGISAMDSAEQLKARLKQLPQGLEKMFSHMLGLIDPQHQNEASIYFRHALGGGPTKPLSICELVFALNTSYYERDLTQLTATESSTLLTECQRLEKRIRCCSAGLLEVTQYQSVRLSPSRAGCRPSCLGDLKKYLMYRSPQLIHRTVYNFLRDQNEAFINLCPISTVNLHHAKSLTVLFSLKDNLLQLHGLEKPDIAFICVDVLNLANSNGIQVSHLTRLRQAVGNDELGRNWEFLSEFTVFFSSNFTELCAEVRAKSFFEKMLQELGDGVTISQQHTLNTALHAVASWGLNERYPYMMRLGDICSKQLFDLMFMLLSKGADPTEQRAYKHTKRLITAWEGFLGLVVYNFCLGDISLEKSCYQTTTQCDVRKLTELFLARGAKLSDAHEYEVRFITRCNDKELTGWFMIDIPAHLILQLADLLYAKEDSAVESMGMLRLVSGLDGERLLQELTPEGSTFLIDAPLPYWEERERDETSGTLNTVDFMQRLQRAQACAEVRQSSAL